MSRNARGSCNGGIQRLTLPFIPTVPHDATMADAIRCVAGTSMRHSHPWAWPWLPCPGIVESGTTARCSWALARRCRPPQTGRPPAPAQRDEAFSRLAISIEEGLTDIAQRLDRVYATTDRALGRAWASLFTPDGTTFPGGALYRVELEAPEPDADLLSSAGLSYEAPRGRILAVYDAQVPYDGKHLRYLQNLLNEHERRRDAADSPAG